MVACEPHEGRHTGILVAKKLDEIIDTLELPEISKALTTDNASNMKVAGKESTHIEKHIGCVDHSLNLIVNAGLKSVKEIQSAVDNFKKLVTSSHKSMHPLNIKPPKFTDSAGLTPTPPYGVSVKSSFICLPLVLIQAQNLGR